MQKTKDKRKAMIILLKMLLKTNQENAIKMPQIIEGIEEECGFTITRQTVYSYIKTFNECGITIKKGYFFEYYYDPNENTSK